MNKLLLQWVKEILEKNQTVVELAIRQRAKFEGWLKFSLAAYIEKNFCPVIVECIYSEKKRADLSFIYEGTKYLIEIKTPNTNWKIKGVEKKGRPITKNIKSIIEDAEKLKSEDGIVLFILFPIPFNDTRWKKYTTRISDALGKDILSNGNYFIQKFKCSEILVCSFIV